MLIINTGCTLQKMTVTFQHLSLRVRNGREEIVVNHFSTYHKKYELTEPMSTHECKYETQGHTNGNIPIAQLGRICSLQQFSDSISGPLINTHMSDLNVSLATQSTVRGPLSQVPSDEKRRP